MESILMEAKELIEKWSGNTTKASQSWGKRMDSSNESWETSRSILFKLVLKSKYAIVQTECQVCELAPAVIRCEECGTRKHLCASCDISVHHSHPLHDRLGVIDGHYKAIPPSLAFSTSSMTNLINIGKIHFSVHVSLIPSTFRGFNKFSSKRLCCKSSHLFKMENLNMTWQK